MPAKATVTGILLDANSAPIAGGKIVATLAGSDVFEGGVTIGTQQVETTTGADGKWSLPLLVNAEGKHGATSWNVQTFDRFAKPITTFSGLFVSSSATIELDDLELLSKANQTAARAVGTARIVTVGTWAEYTALPAGQKTANDIVILTQGA